MAFAGAVVSKPMAKKTTFLSGMLARQLQRIERRIDHAHVAALRLHAQQVLRAAGHAQHVAVGDEDDVGSRCQGNRLVDDLDRRDADRAARPVDERDLLRQHLVDAVLEEGSASGCRRPP